MQRARYIAAPLPYPPAQLHRKFIQIPRALASPSRGVENIYPLNSCSAFLRSTEETPARTRSEFHQERHVAYTVSLTVCSYTLQTYFELSTLQTRAVSRASVQGGRRQPPSRAADTCAAEDWQVGAGFPMGSGSLFYGPLAELWLPCPFSHCNC